MLRDYLEELGPFRELGKMMTVRDAQRDALEHLVLVLLAPGVKQ